MMDEELPVKAVEFESIVTDEGNIALPPEVVEEIPAGGHLRVVVMWEPADPDTGWRLAGRRAFEAAYCPEDSVYDQLTDDTAQR
jgi:hypothetical protein